MNKKWMLTITILLVTILTLTGTSIRTIQAANSPVSGAAFTTTNPTVDGTGHCGNGNEFVNCNIYDSKSVVWLNGGPATAFVGDGTYFFAVLVPGGQGGNNNPNDGTPLNLSDDYDSYTNRTFSVSSGTVSYAGTHSFNSNKIRLMPYANTTNSGGVYILSICSLADGYPVDPSKCKYDAFKVKEEIVIPVASPLTIRKTGSGSFTNAFAWSILKDVDKTLVTQDGGVATFTYTVTVSHNAGTSSAVSISGSISVFNTNVDGSSAVVPVAITGVTDVLSDGTVCTVTAGGAQTLSLAQTNFAYACSLSTLPAGTLSNAATVTWGDQTLSSGALLAAGSATFHLASLSLTENQVDECVTVLDSYAGTLGTVCVGDSNPTTFTYSRTVPVPAVDCTVYGNTAKFITSDTHTTGAASRKVKVCGPTLTGEGTIIP